MKALPERIKTATRSLAGMFGVRDVFVFGGLGLMGYGLHLYEPWVAFSVCGACLMAFGVFGGGRS